LIVFPRLRGYSPHPCPLRFRPPVHYAVFNRDPPISHPLRFFLDDLLTRGLVVFFSFSLSGTPPGTCPTCPSGWRLPWARVLPLIYIFFLSFCFFFLILVLRPIGCVPPPFSFFRQSSAPPFVHYRPFSQGFCNPFILAYFFCWTVTLFRFWGHSGSPHDSLGPGNISFFSAPQVLVQRSCLLAHPGNFNPTLMT